MVLLIGFGRDSRPKRVALWRYEKLRETAEGGGGGRRWVKKLKGGLKGVRLSRCRRLIIRAFSSVRVYVDPFKMDFCPNLVLTSTWGLPVLSHPSSLSCSNRNVIL